jgi:hypothetical protein
MNTLQPAEEMQVDQERDGQTNANTNTTTLEWLIP